MGKRAPAAEDKIVMLSRLPGVCRGSLLLAMALALAAQPGAQQPSTDAIYYNAHIVTMWAGHPTAEAVAIRGNRFLAVGTLAEIRKAVGPSARQIDLHGRTVLPGLEDGHTHPITAALSEQDGPIPVMKSIADIQAWMRKQVATTPVSGLIFLPKIYSTRLTDRRYPTRQELDQAASDRAAMTDNGYSAVLNSAALL